MKTKLYILCGIPFAGKTTLASEMEKQKGYTRIDLDEVKAELIGNTIKDQDISQENWDRIYQEMYKRIEATILKEKTAILDAGNFTRKERNIVRKIGEGSGVEVITIYVDTPKDIAYKRLLENREKKIRFDITNEEFESAISEMQRPKKNEPHLICESSTPFGSWIKENL